MVKRAESWKGCHRAAMDAKRQVFRAQDELYDCPDTPAAKKVQRQLKIARAALEAVDRLIGGLE